MQRDIQGIRLLLVRHGRLGQYGNALLVRGAIDEVEHFALPKPSTRQRRSALIARVVACDIEVNVAVTHLQHHKSGLDETQREAPEQLRALLDRVASRPLPRVVLGDFNLGPPRAEPLLRAAGYAFAGRGYHGAERRRVDRQLREEG